MCINYKQNHQIAKYVGTLTLNIDFFCLFKLQNTFYSLKECAPCQVQMILEEGVD